ncbi:MAG: ABC transporter substrate-binding protein [Myxococcota bacterium]
MRKTLCLCLAAAACVKGGKQESGEERGDLKAQAASQTPIAAQSPLDDGPPVAGGQIVVHLEVEPAHLSLFINPDLWTRRITVPMVYDTLLREDAKTFEYTPALAQRWEVSPDNLSYTFHIRPGVTWHDGTPFTSKDVKFTFDKLYDPSVRAQAMRASFEPFCDRWEAPDDATFVLHCRKRYFMMLSSIADLPIQPAHIFGKGDFNKHEYLRKPVGTGPYRFESWTAGREIVLARNDAYYGKKGFLDKIVYMFVESPVTAVQLAKKGELDFMGRVREAQWVGEVQTDAALRENFQRITDWPNGFAFLVFNTARPIFADKRVRQALASLFDRQRILDTIMHGQGRLTDSVYYFKLPSYAKDLPPVVYDPERAKKLLDEAGWKDSDGDGVRDRDGKPFHLTYLATVGSTTMQKWLTLFQEDLRKAGVTLEISTVEWATFQERLRKHNFDAGSLVSVWTSPRMDPFELFHTSQIADGQNYASYSNLELDRLLEQMRSELDETKRAALDRRIQQITREELPIFPQYNNAVNAIVHKRIRGVVTSPMWYQLQEWWIPKALQAAAR